MMSYKLKSLSVFIIILLNVLTLSSVNAKSLSASIDRNEVGIADTFTLTLVAQDIVTLAQPDFSAMANEFDILSQRVSHNIENINGVNNQSITWSLQLRPKKLGSVLIPSFSLSGEKSNSLTVLVKKTDIAQQDNKDFQLQLLANKASAKVNEQIIMTLRLTFAKNVNALEASKFVLDNARIEKLVDKNYETTINGRNYGVYEISYAVFIHEPGEIEIPVQQVNIGLGQRSFFNNRNTQTLALQSNPIKINVSAIDDAQQQNVLIADDLKLTESWSGLNDSLNLGDSITREITLQVTGVLAQTIPPITQAQISGLKVYPEPASKEELKTAKGISVIRSRSFAIVATQAGELVLPEMSIPWWNTQTKQFETALLPEKKIIVKAAPVSDDTMSSSQLNEQLSGNGDALSKALQQTDTQPLAAVDKENINSESVTQIVEKPVNKWLIVIIVFLLLVIALLAVLLLRSQKKPKAVSTQKVGRKEANEKEQFNKLCQQLETKDYAAVYYQYHQWKQLFTRANEPSKELKHSLKLLEQTLYSNTQPLAQWDGAEFKKLLSAYRQQLLSKQDKQKNIALELYQETS
jgi:hypothetical protein